MRSLCRRNSEYKHSILGPKICQTLGASISSNRDASYSLCGIESQVEANFDRSSLWIVSMRAPSRLHLFMTYVPCFLGEVGQGRTKSQLQYLFANET